VANTSGRLVGKVALITGAASGLAPVVARMFIAEGAKVMLSDVRPEGKAIADEIGEGASFVTLDVTREEDWAEAVAATESAFGALNVLINNAQWTGRQPIQTSTRDSFLKTISVCQLGPYLGTRAVIDPMERAGGGSIINMGSIDSLRPAPDVIGYTSAKFGLRGVTMAAAAELCEIRVRVNIIHTGPVYRTPPFQRPDVPDDWDRYAAAVPLGRFTEPEEVGYMAIFLASEESAHCTGAEFVIDGGQSAVRRIPFVDGHVAPSWALVR
jgi:3alpha(or 20beta)-hydroxysteroid dehydrogenase